MNPKTSKSRPRQFLKNIEKKSPGERIGPRGGCVAHWGPLAISINRCRIFQLEQNPDRLGSLSY
jgi:hypothetical protein